MRNERPARLYSNRKQLVVVVTYGSSVTLPVWAVSHPPAPLSKRRHTPSSSISISACLLLTVFQPFFRVLRRPRRLFPVPPCRPLLTSASPIPATLPGTLCHETTPLSTSGAAHYSLLCAQSIPPQRSDTKSFRMAVQSEGPQTEKSE